jgi:hypothetical protein
MLAGMTITIVAALGLPAGARPLPSRPGAAAPAVSGQLFAVSADSPADAWAVGRLRNQQSQVALHWDGTSWSPVTIPVTGVELFGVSAISPTNAWAVGMSNVSEPVALHWDGGSWTTVPVPGTGAAEDVSADSATDVWVVGTNPAESHTEAWHGDGSTFAQVPTPSPWRRINALFGVSARSRADVWAVGGGGGGGRTLVEHWNGTSWSHVLAPAPGQSSFLNGVTAISASDAWAVGDFFGRVVGNRVLTLHWDGTAWHQVYAPSPGSVDNSLEAVSATSATDVWAVGGFKTSNGLRRTVSVHWDGTSWRRVHTPNPGGGSKLSGVSAVSATDAWAVGWTNLFGGGQVPLILRWNGTAWASVQP